MTFIVVSKGENKETPFFQKDDLVFLKDGKEHKSSYKNRPVIVTSDMNRGDRNFKGFCLVSNELMDNFAADCFEFSATNTVTISN
jgi:hypothetical protein